MSSQRGVGSELCFTVRTDRGWAYKWLNVDYCYIDGVCGLVRASCCLFCKSPRGSEDLQKRCLSLDVEGIGCCGRRWKTATVRTQTVFNGGEGRGRCRKACAEKHSSYGATLWPQLGPCPRAEWAAPCLQSWTSARPESPAAPSSASTTRAATSVPAKRGSSRTPTAAPATVSAWV